MQAALEQRRRELEKKDRIKAGLLAFVSFAGVIVCCFFLVAFTKSIPPPGEQFVAVGFADAGDALTASGDVESEVPSETVEEVVQPETSQSESNVTSEIQEVVTQQNSEVAVPSNPNSVKPTEPDKQPEPERQVNSRLSNAFNALSQSGGGGSEGASESGKGNEGAENGRIDGRGVVTGNEGDYVLNGGRIVGFPIQEEIPHAEGVVRVKIVVDKHGKVTAATYDGTYSSTADTELIAMACRAAKTITWTENLVMPVRTGYVIIRFELE